MIMNIKACVDEYGSSTTICKLYINHKMINLIFVIDANTTKINIKIKPEQMNVPMVSTYQQTSLYKEHHAPLR